MCADCVIRVRVCVQTDCVIRVRVCVQTDCVIRVREGGREIVREINRGIKEYREDMGWRD